MAAHLVRLLALTLALTLALALTAGLLLRTAHLRARAAGRYFRSGTAGEDTTETPVRTSSSLWLDIKEMQTDEIFAAVNQRIYDNIEVIVRESNRLENTGAQNDTCARSPVHLAHADQNCEASRKHESLRAAHL